MLTISATVIEFIGHVGTLVYVGAAIYYVARFCRAN